MRTTRPPKSEAGQIYARVLLSYFPLGGSPGAEPNHHNRESGPPQIGATGALAAVRTALSPVSGAGAPTGADRGDRGESTGRHAYVAALGSRASVVFARSRRDGCAAPGARQGGLRRRTAPSRCGRGRALSVSRPSGSARVGTFRMPARMRASPCFAATPERGGSSSPPARTAGSPPSQWTADRILRCVGSNPTCPRRQREPKCLRRRGPEAVDGGSGGKVRGSGVRWAESSVRPAIGRPRETQRRSRRELLAKLFLVRDEPTVPRR
jgi:hypothetical protein